MTPDQYRTQQAKSMSEDDLLGHVLTIAAGLQLLVHHCRPARQKDGTWRTPIQGDAGFPDLVIVGTRGTAYRELKRQDGRPTAPQRRWLAYLTASGQNARTWRPADLVDGTILAELKELT